MVIGGGGQALMLWLALSSLAYVSVATLAFLFYTYPAWVALVQAASGAERIDGRAALALTLSFGGIALMVGRPQGATAVGYALALGAAIVYGLYIPAMARLQRDHPVTVTTACAQTGAAACFVILALIDRTLSVHLAPAAWMSILALALACTLIPMVFFLMGLIRLGPVRTAIVSTVEPFLTAILGLVTLHQPLAAPTLMGGLLIIAAVLILQTRRP
jgi:drug/metabolite transporter (DMT)-like permease